MDSLDETELDLKALLSTLRRRWRLIVITFAVVVVAALLVTFSLTPKYTASTQVIVDINAKDLLDPIADQSSAGTASSRVDSEVEIAKSKKILLDVISELGLVSDREFGVRLSTTETLMAWLGLAKAELPKGTEALNQVLAKLSSAISIRRIGLTYLIEISATSSAPDKAAKISNAVAKAYIAAQVGSKVENTLAARNVLEGRLSAASSAVAGAEQSFDDFISSNIDSIARESGRFDITLLRDELNDAVSQNTVQSRLIDQAQKSIAVGDWTSLAATLGDQALAELASQREALSSQVQTVAAGSERETDLRAELDALNAKIANYSQTQLRSIRQDVAEGEQKASDLRTQLRTSVLASDLPPTTLTQIYGLQQNAEIARSQYQNLLGRVRDLEAQSQVQIADSRIVSEALPPSLPSFPNNGLILALAGMVGLGLGVGLAFLWENFVGGFTTDAQVENLLHLEVAAVIPTHPLTLKAVDKAEIISPADLMHLSPMSTYAESVRRLRANVDIAFGRFRSGSLTNGTEGKVVLVTSAIPREGKSSTALSLARSYALSGHKTLIIDCDLRKPSIHNYLGLSPDGGLVDFVLQTQNAESLMHAIGSDRHSSLSAIVSGRNSNTPTDQIVSNPALASLIEKARGIFDVVILDSPPLVPVVDGLYLAGYADCVVLVVQWGATSQSIVRQAVQTLRLGASADTPILTVLSQQQGRRDNYNSKYYYYYGAGA